MPIFLGPRFLTPATIGHSCQHSSIFPALLGCHSKSVQVWPCGMEPIISKLLHRLCNQGELPPSYIMGWSHSHPPDSKQGCGYLTYLWNQLKVIDMLNDHSRSYLQNCCYSRQVSMALLHASHPPAQTCRGEDILYMYFSNISWTPNSGPHYKSPFAPSTWAAPCYTTCLHILSSPLNTLWISNHSK